MSAQKAQAVFPQAERQRKLQALTFSPSNILSRDLPRDTVLKGLQLRLHGAVQTTFASGTPVADAFGAFDNLIPRIDVIVSGSRTVKSVRPYLMRMQQLFSTSVAAEQRSSAGAAAATGDFPTVDQTPVYGTTTQYTSVAESIYVPFEMIWCDPYKGREGTWLNLKGVASAELRLTTAAYSALLGFGNTAPVTYANSTLSIDVVTIEAQDVPPTLVFSDWKQTTKEQTYSAQQTSTPIDINRGNKLSGLWFLCRDGAAGSSTTASGKLRSNLAMQAFSLKLNGQTEIKASTFQILQNENRARYGISAAMASNVSPMDGVAFLNLIARHDISTALDVTAPLVDNVQLFVDTDNSTDVSYTNPISIVIQTDEIVLPR